MSKLKTIATALGLTAGAAGAAVAVKKIKSAYQLELENCTGDTLDISSARWLRRMRSSSSVSSPARNAASISRACRSGEHDVVYIRFPDTAARPGYKRTLIYDTEECKSPMHGMIVDYGDGNYDVKLVRVG